jgi:tRNA A-37 threonylcarbamoyl transferase component Bud32
MSKLRKENFINFLFPFKYQIKKTTIINFLSEIYANYHKRCNKIFDSYSFQELMQLPMIVCNKMFQTFTSKDNTQMNVDEFSINIFNLFFGDIDDKMSMIFDLLDFDGDGAIIYEDVFLILSHLHLMEFNYNSIYYIEEIISIFFDNKTKIEKDNFFNLNKNFDVLLLVLLFLNKYQTLITEEELTFYEACLLKKTKKSEFVLNYKYTYSIKNDIYDEYEELEYKPSELLLDYLEIIDFGKKKKRIIREFEDDEEFYDNEDQDLSALFDFSMNFKELKERFINECNLEPRLFTSTFSSMFQEETGKKRKKRDQEINEQVNDILKNQLLKNLKKEKKKDRKISNKKLGFKKLRTEESYSYEKATQINSTVGDLEINKDYKKTNSLVNNSGINFSFIKKFNPKFQIKNEIILKKENGKSKKKMVKLFLFNNYIFYYITLNNNNFLFKKIMPIVNLFIHKKKIDDLTHVKLISQSHNTTLVKEFSCDDYEKVFNFCQKFNNVNYHRDIAKEYYFKYEIDQGKFGHVFLAKSISEEKKYAIKLVQKKNQSFEEYKINRNEIDIFHLLQNIDHPNIVKCIDLVENETQLFFVYEYLPCGNLKKYLQDLKFFPSDYNIDTVLKITKQLLEGAFFLHKYGIIHRDIKTTNIMVQINSPFKKSVISTSMGVNGVQKMHEDMSDVTLKIIDFGLSKIMGENEMTNEPYGSLSYKAPELILHKYYNFKVDVWSIGITIYYIVYKVLPFEEGNREDIKNAIINRPVPFYANDLMVDAFYFKSFIGNKNNSSKNLKSSIIYSILKDSLIKNPKERFSIEDLYYKYYDLI